MSLIGEIICEKNGHFVWNIENFRELWETYQLLWSPNFTYSGREYYLGLDKVWNTNIYASFDAYCHRLPKSLYVEFQLRTEDNIVTKLHGNTLRQGYHHTKVSVDCKEFVSEESGTLLPDRFSVLCWVTELNDSDVLKDELRCDTSSDSQTLDEEETNSETINKMLKDLKSLLSSGENSDVTLVVEGKEFPAHRIILCARSPVFKAILCHDTPERDSDPVYIYGCEPDRFQDFLTYVYTGSTRHIVTGNVISLYTTSVKYLMRELKLACVSFMKANMSVEGFCGIAILALRHDEKELIQSATDFFCENSKEITEMENWVTFLEENPKEANEHFIKPLTRRL